MVAEFLFLFMFSRWNAVNRLAYQNMFFFLLNDIDSKLNMEWSKYVTSITRFLTRALIFIQAQIILYHAIPVDFHLLLVHYDADNILPSHRHLNSLFSSISLLKYFPCSKHATAEIYLHF